MKCSCKVLIFYFKVSMACSIYRSVLSRGNKQTDMDSLAVLNSQHCSEVQFCWLAQCVQLLNLGETKNGVAIAAQMNYHLGFSREDPM